MPHGQLQYASCEISLLDGVLGTGGEFQWSPLEAPGMAVA